jgi:hypothetical protein
MLRIFRDRPAIKEDPKTTDWKTKKDVDVRCVGGGVVMFDIVCWKKKAK